MKMKVMGLTHKQGEYKGQKYDNFYLYVQYGKDGVSGVVCESVKLKSEFMANVCADAGIGIGDLLGKTIDVSYNRYGTPEQLEIVE